MLGLAPSLGLQRVRRRQKDATFLPSGLPDLAVWLSPQRNVSTDASGYVDVLPDLSGNGQDASQASASERPGLIVNDNRFWLDFSGGQYLDIGSIGSAVEALFIVWQPASDIAATTPGQSILGLTGSSYVGLGTITGSLTDEIITINGNDGDKAAWTSASDVVLAAEPHMMAIVWNGTNYVVYSDGIERPTTTIGTPALFNVDNVQLGRRANNDFPFFYNGTIGEVIGYSSFDPDDRTTIEAYMASEWGIAS